MNKIMIKLKNYIAYFLMFWGIIIILKTFPSAIYNILYDFNIKNTISLDMANCHTFALSIIKTDFFYGLFLFAVLLVLVGLLLLFREQKLNFNRDHFNVGFFIIFLVLLGQSFILLAYVSLFILEYSLFNKHIIYPIAFAIGCLTNLLFFILYSLIWFDKILNKKFKLFFIFILCSLSTHFCIDMFSFIDMYGVISMENGTGPETYFEAFNYIFVQLGIGILCMEDNNPCHDLFIKMTTECDLARSSKAIPRIPNGGGVFALRWIARIMNTSSTIYKSNNQYKCNNARKEYRSCEDFLKTVNNSKRK